MRIEKKCQERFSCKIYNSQDFCHYSIIKMILLEICNLIPLLCYTQIDLIDMQSTPESGSLDKICTVKGYTLCTPYNLKNRALRTAYMT